MAMIELPYGFAQRVYFHHIAAAYSGAPELTPARVIELINEEELTSHQRQWWREKLREEFSPEDDNVPMGTTLLTWVLTHIDSEPPYLDPFDPDDYDYHNW